MSRKTQKIQMMNTMKCLCIYNNDFECRYVLVRDSQGCRIGSGTWSSWQHLSHTDSIHSCQMQFDRQGNWNKTCHRDLDEWNKSAWYSIVFTKMVSYFHTPQSTYLTIKSFLSLLLSFAIAFLFSNPVILRMTVLWKICLILK